ncbi:CLUMA_CG010415, isoform A [Clunio marinus]|uniref:CLUMA_CG010415, isoform A n=1 Tax=Clunio marinus TaxID=568069 RepID=A0A1J1IER2_9DIPT|nr:CLUMA_CG010415, isoform A [Clunio marinus]
MNGVGTWCGMLKFNNWVHKRLKAPLRVVSQKQSECVTISTENCKPSTLFFCYFKDEIKIRKTSPKKKDSKD